MHHIREAASLLYDSITGKAIISAAVFIPILAMMPAGIPDGFVPFALFGIVGFWIWRHHVHLEAATQDAFERELRALLGGD